MRSARLAIAAFVLAIVVGLVAITVGPLSRVRTLAGTNNVLAVADVVKVPPGSEACETSLIQPGSADRVRVGFTAMDAGQELSVLLKDPTGEVLDRASVKVLRRGIQDLELPVIRAGQDRLVALCVLNKSARGFSLRGEAGKRTVSGLRLDKRELPNVDMSVEFHRARPRPLLQMFPQVAQRAAVFKFSFMTPAIVGALLISFLFAIALVGVACFRAFREDRGTDAAGGSGTMHARKEPS